VTICFFCGEVIQGEPVTVLDKVRGRTLHFCNDTCRLNQIGSNNTLPHYTRFPRSRKTHIDMAASVRLYSVPETYEVSVCHMCGEPVIRGGIKYNHTFWSRRKHKKYSGDVWFCSLACCEKHETVLHAERGKKHVE
jgi:hypothetical protein